MTTKVCYDVGRALSAVGLIRTWSAVARHLFLPRI